MPIRLSFAGSTSWTRLLLISYLENDGLVSEKESEGRKVADLKSRSVNWLLQVQDEASGGWGEQPGKRPNALNTAEAVLALVGGGLDVGDKQIQQGIQFLTGQKQSAKEPDAGAWTREVNGVGGAKRLLPDVVRTAVVIRALIRAGAVNNEQVKSAIDWLIDVQSTDGGWPFRRDASGELLPTCLSLRALIAAGGAGEKEKCEKPVRDGLDYLQQHAANADGSFGADDRLRGGHTIQAVLVLQEARNRRVAEHVSLENGVIDWLMRNPDKSHAMVEERIRVDPLEAGSGDYGYLFMTESLLVQALAGAYTVEHHRSRLYRGAMMGLGERFDETTGAFYGERVFSWSTAKAINALSAAQQHFSEIPKRDPEYSGAKTGPWIFGFALLLAGIAAYLSVIGVFGRLQAVFFVFLMLALLLVYGHIREKTFKELFSGLGLAQRSKMEAESGND